MNSINKSTDSQMRTDKTDNEVPPDVSQRIATTDKWSNDETYKDLKKQLEQLNIGKSNGSSNNVPSNNVDEVKIESESNKWNLTDSWIKEGSNELSKKQAEQIEATVNSETNCDVSKDDRDKNEESDDPLISISSDTEIRSLADIHVTLENIKPGMTYFKKLLLIFFLLFNEINFMVKIDFRHYPTTECHRRKKWYNCCITLRC